MAKRNERITVIRPHYDYKASSPDESWDVLMGDHWEIGPAQLPPEQRLLHVYGWRTDAQGVRHCMPVASYKPDQWKYVYYTRNLVE